jgi:hypothetical protein
MTKNRKNQKEFAPRIVESGANWQITRMPGSTDYDAHIAERGYIGSRPTPTAARMLIAEYNVPEVK